MDRPTEATQGAEPAGQPTGAGRRRDAARVPKTRTALVNNAVLAFVIVLILLLVFILENTESVKISYFGAGFHLSLGVALLLAAIGGALVTGIIGAARIMQLRRSVRRRH